MSTAGASTCVAAAAKAAEQLVYAQFVRDLLQINLKYGLGTNGLPSVDDPDFVSALARQHVVQALRDLDAATRKAIHSSSSVIDVAAATTACDPLLPASATFDPWP